MHPTNSLYWDTCKDRFPELFRDRRVAEFGSYDVNGTVRDYFEDCTYIGVDWRDGPGVDFVAVAQDFDAAQRFDTVISASMLEHDPYWNMSLRKMVEVLNDDGALLLSWGSALNLSHEEETCPDYDKEMNPKPFHPRPVRHVLDLLEKLGMHIQEFRYEFNVWKDEGRDVNKAKKSQGFAAGIFFKNEDHVRKDKVIVDLLYPEDMGMKLPKLRGRRYEHLYYQMEDLLRDDSKGYMKILEIGVYDGGTAEGLIKLCISMNCTPHYSGIDLFEEMTRERQKKEIGKSKLCPSIEKVRARLRSASMIGTNIRGYVDIFKGDSVDLLPKFVEKGAKHFQDFIFIDGGHSIETVRSDWSCVRSLMHDSTVVMFDDYYHHDKNLGPRILIDELMKDSAFKVELLDPIDTIRSNGMKIGMAKLVMANS